ncbi:5-guanidino-2-oxopentanoate decarboxylase [Taklimakanibacter lacteus]|uniref:5-guanidino-2-oxopentanoate decarboxylase n=1 Tax=Taklimakanibacter lacteus TaxID=2268456 RepID=UPI000E663EE6
MPTCGEHLVKLLEAYGVETIFGIPGVHTVELYRGLEATNIRHVTPRHEQGAGFMADGYARSCGKPGVCFIITGPGMTNIATAMGQAYADSIPMLVISSVNDTSHLGMGQGRLHELPSQRNLIAGVAAFSHTLLYPGQLPEVLARAFAVFTSARPRPVHIEIPLDVITARMEGPAKAWTLPSRPAPDPTLIAEAAKLLAAAKSPLIIAGGGACDAAQGLQKLAEKLDAPVFTTINGKGVLPPGHSLALAGNLGMEVAQDELAQSDVVLAIGTEFGETEMYPEARPIHIKGKLIRIDIDPLQLVNQLQADIALFADSALAVQALNDALGKHDAKGGKGEARAAALRRKVVAGLWPACTIHGRLLAAITRALPDVVIAGDQTEPVYAANQTYEAPRPRSYFNSSTGYGTLGYGLPAAIGAKLGQPARPSVCLIGDGGLQFSLPELASAVEAQVPVAVVIWNNTGYGEIKAYMRDRQIPEIGVDIYTPDFVTIAKGLGCEAARPADMATLHDELVKSAKRKVPTIIEIRSGESLARELGR